MTMTTMTVMTMMINNNPKHMVVKRKIGISKMDKEYSSRIHTHISEEGK